MARLVIYGMPLVSLVALLNLLWYCSKWRLKARAANAARRK